GSWRASTWGSRRIVHAQPRRDGRARAILPPRRRRVPAGEIALGEVSIGPIAAEAFPLAPERRRRVGARRPRGGQAAPAGRPPPGRVVGLPRRRGAADRRSR